MKDDAFLSIIKDADPDYSDENISTTGFIDTGSYALNALLSASVFGGIPNNRVTAYAGESGTGKTFFALSGVKEFLQRTEEEKGTVIYFDTEFALEKSMFEKRDIDTKRLFLMQPDTLQSFKTTGLRILDKIEKMEEADKRPVLMVLDSLGNLPTLKEVEDGLSGKDVSDMTRAKIIRSIFRTLTLKMGKVSVPMILTNHTYTQVGAYVPTQTMGGGGGVVYAASTIAFLSKKKDKDGNDVIGNIITVKTEKSRYSKPNQKVELKLDYNKGLDRFYGLLPIAEKYDIIKKVTTRYELPDGTRLFEKQIYADPERFFTKDILQRIDEVCKKEFGVGEIGIDEENTEEETKETE